MYYRFLLISLIITLLNTTIYAQPTILPIMPENIEQLQRNRPYEGQWGGNNTLEYAPSSEWMVSGGNDGVIIIWDTADYSIRQSLTGHSDSVTDIAIHPDENQIASVSRDGTLRIWNLETGTHRIIPTSDDPSLSVDFDTTGQYLTSVSNGMVQVWDTIDDTVIRTIDSFNDIVRYTLFTPDGHLVSATLGGLVQVWDLETGDELQSNNESEIIRNLIIIPDGQFMVSTYANNRLIQHNLQTGSITELYTGNLNQEITAINYHSSSNRLFVTYVTGYTNILNATTGEYLDSFNLSAGTVADAGLQSDLGHLAIAYAGQPLSIWDIQTGEMSASASGHHRTLDAIVFSADGTRMVSAGRSGDAFLWDVDTAEIIQTVPSVRPIIALNADGTQIFATVDFSTDMLWWDVETASSIRTINYNDRGKGVISIGDTLFRTDRYLRRTELNEPSISNRTYIFYDFEEWALEALTAHPDQNSIFVSSRNAEIYRLSVETATILQTYPTEATAQRMTISGDGTTLVAGVNSRAFTIIDVESGEARTQVNISDTFADALALNHDGSLLMLGTRDGVITVWDTHTGDELLILADDLLTVNALAFSPDGQRLLAVGQTGIIAWQLGNE